MSLRSLVCRRPPASLVVSFLALFVALGGAGWAAIRIPANSVGSAQLRNFSVGNAKLGTHSVGPAKIIPGSVGSVQVNSSQVQLRAAGPCTTGAIQSIAQSGDVTCTQVLPNEYGSGGTASTVSSDPASPTQLTSESLTGSQAGASYLVLGTVRVSATDVAGVAQTVSVQCGLGRTGSSAANSATTSGATTLDLGGAYATAGSETIPLVLPVTVTGNPQTVAISCDQSAAPATPAPSLGVTATINTVQTAANN